MPRLRCVRNAPNPRVVLREFTSHFRPASGWRGSLATVLESNATLLSQLEAYPALKDAVAEEKAWVMKWIEEERRRETLWDRERDERFE
jgi:hypothetical protein